MGFTSCSNDYVNPEFNNNSFGVYRPDGLTLQFFNPGEVVALMDISQNELSHTFSFLEENEVGADLNDDSKWDLIADDEIHFLRMEPENLPDNNLDDYSEFYDEGVPTVNDKKTVIFVLPKPGRYNVRVRNVYNAEVFYRFFHKRENVMAYYYSKPVGDGTHYIEQNFETVIYDSLYKSATQYTDETYSVPMKQADPLEPAEDYVPEESLYADAIDHPSKYYKDEVSNVNCIDVTVGDTLYFMEDAMDDSCYSSSTNFEWWCEYAGVDAPQITPTATIEFEEKTNDKPGRSKMKVTFDQEGMFYLYMYQARVAMDDHPYSVIPDFPDSSWEGKVTAYAYKVNPVAAQN